MHNRLNFSFTHELGNTLLDHQRYFRNNIEMRFRKEEADEFAGRFLVPEEELAIMPPHSKPDIPLLSNHFHVSESVIRIRYEKIFRSVFVQKVDKPLKGLILIGL